MSQNDPAPYVPPDEKTPRIYGTLNIIFGSLLLLCNIGQCGFYVAAPVLKKAVEAWQVQLTSTLQAQHEARLNDLKRREAAATTEAEKAKAKDDLDSFRAQPQPDMSMMTSGFVGFDDRRLVTYGVTEILTGIVLNTLMIVSGAALLSYKGWGRRWAVAIAGVKLARLAALVCVSIAIIIPIQVKMTEAQMQKAAAQIKAGPGGPKAPVLMAMTPQAISAMSTAGIVLNALAAAVYPTLVLVMLTRPRVKAACTVGEARDPEAFP